MKAKILLLALLLSTSQLFAFGNGERSALLGFIGGVVATTIYQNHTSAPNYERYDTTVRYEPIPFRVQREHHYKREHRHMRKRVVKEIYYYSDDDYKRPHQHHRDCKYSHRH